MLTLLLQLCREYLVPRPDVAEFSGIGPVKRAMDYLRRNALQAVTLDQVAAHAGVSKFYLARQFKAYTGKTVVQTVQLLRCTEARRLLEEGTSVSAAAAACGFENLSYFSRTFKKQFGLLPSEAARKKGTPAMG